MVRFHRFKLSFEDDLRTYSLLLTLLLFVLGMDNTQAQMAYAEKPYLVSASIYMSVNTQADVWLNGIHIAHCPHTTMALGPKTVLARPDSLCYFKKDNVLSIKLEGGKGASGGQFVGIAYAFSFTLSDGSSYVINSSSPGEHRSLYIPKRGTDEPDGWQDIRFDDSLWPLAKNSSEMIPDTASLSGSTFGGAAKFLTASSTGYFIQHPGEKHLFRRHFGLDISVNPRCLPKPAALFRPKKPTSTFLASVTPVVIPTHKEPLAASPQLAKAPHQTTFSVLSPMKTWPTSTPTMTAPMPTVVPVESNPTATVVPVATVHLLPTMVIQDDGAVVFGQSYANILVLFGDGPGYYKVEAVDSNHNHLKTLLNQRIINTSEMWLTWDGKDEQGKDVPVGQYFILCSKEGAVLQTILLRRAP
jgi:hypothetical protein